MDWTSLIMLIVGGLLSPLLLNLINHLFGREDRQYKRFKDLQDELWDEVHKLRDKIERLEKFNDDLQVVNLKLIGEVATQEHEIAVLRGDLQMLTLENGRLRDRIKQLETDRNGT